LTSESVRGFRDLFALREPVLILINEHMVAAWLLARVSFQRESA
jgi:hypothetical protein